MEKGRRQLRQREHPAGIEDVKWKNTSRNRDNEGESHILKCGFGASV